MARSPTCSSPARYTLETKNLPLLSTIQGWKYGFDSPFKAEVYFVATRQVTELKWGTPNPIIVRDPELGPVRVRAFGTYTLKATNPRQLLTELVGTDGEFNADEITALLRAIIVNAFTELAATTATSVIDLAGSYPALSERLRKAVGRADRRRVRPGRAAALDRQRLDAPRGRGGARRARQPCRGG